MQADLQAQAEFKAHLRPLLRQVATAFLGATVEVWAVDEHSIGLKPILTKVWCSDGGRHLTLYGLIMLTSIAVNSLPAAQRSTVIQQVTAINAQPAWFPLPSAWERLRSFPLQLALSVIVLHVCLRHQVRWLLLAILWHAPVDFVAVALP